jgi:hypothetical protein
MKRRKSEYSYKPQPLKEAAQEVTKIQSIIGKQKSILKELEKQEGEAIKKLVTLLKDSNTKSAELDLIKFKLDAEGNLKQFVVIK